MAERGMGRGLSALLAPVPENGDARERAAPHPRRAHRAEPAPAAARVRRGRARPAAESLRERGVLQPVLVRPVPGGTYELIAGERRWRAAQLAGFDTVPALVRPHDDAESLELALIENMAREDLNPVEEARACALLVEELGLTREDVGRRVGRSRVAVSNLLRLLDLPDEVLELLAAGHLSEGHGRALLIALRPRRPPPPRRAAPSRRAGACARPRREPARAGRRRPRAGATRPPTPAPGPGRGRPPARRRARPSARHRGPASPRAATATGSSSTSKTRAPPRLWPSRLGALEPRLTPPIAPL